MVRTGLIVLALLVSACRQTGEGDYVRLAGNLFIFNYREAVATYVISLQRLRQLPEGTEWIATFEDPAGGQPLIVRRRIFPGAANIAVESEPVFCIKSGRDYVYEVRIMHDNRLLQAISGTMRSTLDQTVLPEMPLVAGPGYHINEKYRLKTKNYMKDQNKCKYK